VEPSRSDDLHGGSDESKFVTNEAPSRGLFAEVGRHTLPVGTKLVPTWQLNYARWLVLADVVAVLLAVAFGQWVRFGSAPEGGLSRC